MVQIIKTNIRWRTARGDIVGAYSETSIELPKWGKKCFMRAEIDKLIRELQEQKSKRITPPRSFYWFVIDEFSLDSICSIKSRTKGSFINLKDECLKQYITAYKERSCRK